MRKFILQNKFYFIAVILCIIIVQIISMIVANPLLFPDIYSILMSLKDIISDRSFFTIIFNTMSSFIMTLVVLFLLAVFLVILAYNCKFLKNILDAFFSVIISIPTVVIIILVLIWYNIQIIPSIVVITIVLPVLYKTIMTGINNIGNDIISLNKIYKVSKLSLLKNIYIPGTYYYIAGTLSSIISLAFKINISAEIISQKNHTIGSEIFINKTYLEISKVFGWIVIIIIINCILSLIMDLINKKFSNCKSDQ